MEKLLSEFSVGEKGVVKKVNGEGAIRRRLFDMGVTPGTSIYLRKKVLSGDFTETITCGHEPLPRKVEGSNAATEAARRPDPYRWVT